MLHIFSRIEKIAFSPQIINLIRHMPPYLILILSILFVTACSERTPDCASKDTLNMLTQSITKEYQDKGLNIEEKKNLIKVNEVRIVSHDEKLDAYKCSATVFVEAPKELSIKLQKMLLSDGGIQKIENRIYDLYGFADGLKIKAYLMGGLGYRSYLIFYGNSTEAKIIALREIESSLIDITSTQSFPIEYDVFKVSSDGKTTPSLEWRAEEVETEFIMLMYKLNSTLN